MKAIVRLVECCEAALTDGPSSCTCWQPEYDLEQAPLDLSAPVTTRETMCADCAYRPSSPERQGEEDYVFGDEELPVGDEPFWCHQGMRKPVRWRHPAGIVVEVTGDFYEPPQRVVDGAGIPFRADGTPGQRCAGWAAAAARVAAVIAEVAE